MHAFHRKMACATMSMQQLTHLLNGQRIDVAMLFTVQEALRGPAQPQVLAFIW